MKTKIDFSRFSKVIEKTILTATKQEMKLFALDVRTKAIDFTPLGIGEGRLKSGWGFRITNNGFGFVVENKLPYAAKQDERTLFHHTDLGRKSFSEFAKPPKKPRSSYKTPREVLKYQRGYRLAKRGGLGTSIQANFTGKAMTKGDIAKFVMKLERVYGVKL